ncbi:unnamed protein product [Closterium sp. NIES-53]
MPAPPLASAPPLAALPVRLLVPPLVQPKTIAAIQLVSPSAALHALAHPCCRPAALLHVRGARLHPTLLPVPRGSVLPACRRHLVALLAARPSRVRPSACRLRGSHAPSRSAARWPQRQGRSPA